jgi:zinc protease
MVRFKYLAAVALLVGPAVPARESAANEFKPVFPYPIHKTVLDNGLTVLSVPIDSPGIIAYYTVVRTGSRNEVEKGLSGFAHFFEHMMFRGTEAYPEEKYNDVLKSLGADSNAYT